MRLSELNRLSRTILPKKFINQVSTTMVKMQLSRFWVKTLTRKFVCQSACRRRRKAPRVLKND